MGVFKICLIRADTEFDDSQFYNTLCSYFVHCLFFSPYRTRKIKTIDNLFFSKSEFSTTSGILTLSVNDDFIQFVILGYFMKSLSPCKSNTKKGNFNFGRNKCASFMRL